jgi:hypothetical protein
MGRGSGARRWQRCGNGVVVAGGARESEMGISLSETTSPVSAAGKERAKGTTPP